MEFPQEQTSQSYHWVFAQKLNGRRVQSILSFWWDAKKWEPNWSVDVKMSFYLVPIWPESSFISAILKEPLWTDLNRDKLVVVLFFCDANYLFFILFFFIFYFILFFFPFSIFYFLFIFIFYVLFYVLFSFYVADYSI